MTDETTQHANRLTISEAKTRQAAGLAGAVEDGQLGSDEVPEASARVVLNWVGGDKGRAQRALEAEQARSEQRSTVIDPLERMLADEDTSS